MRDNLSAMMVMNGNIQLLDVFVFGASFAISALFTLLLFNVVCIA